MSAMTGCWSEHLVVMSSHTLSQSTHELNETSQTLRVIVHLDNRSTIIEQVVGSGKVEHGVEGGCDACQDSFVNAKDLVGIMFDS